jgi:hypothetical protein
MTLIMEKKTNMKIDFDYLDSLYAETPQVKMMRKTKIVEDVNMDKKRSKKKKDYNIVRMFKYEGYED